MTYDNAAPRHDSMATIRATQTESDGGDSPHVLPVPSKENEWLGFCSSAAKLQNGDKKSSFKRRTDYTAAFAASGVTTLYCAAKNCAYAGHISVDTVWKLVMKDDQRSLKVRWAFLAKSHVFQTKVTGRQFEFQCPICIFCQGHADGCTWKGVDTFMDHVWTHRGKKIPIEVLEKLKIVDDHIADDRDDFDLNFYPTALTRARTSITDDTASSTSSISLSRASTRNSIVDALWSRKDSRVDTSPAVSRAQTLRSDRADSVVGATPIGEGMKNFAGILSVVAEADRSISESESWAQGLSEFRVDREEEYLSPDF